MEDLSDIQLPIDMQPTLRLKTSPNDANRSGDIFGGWLMSQLDIAGAIVAYERAKGNIATVAVKDLQFKKPLFVYDLVSFYAKVVSVGKTSLTVHVEVYAQRNRDGKKETVKVADSTIVYVAVSKPGVKRELSK